MKTQEFRRIMKRLQEPDGKEYFEKYVQYCGWWFLQLTEIQCYKLVDFLHTNFGYKLRYDIVRDGMYVDTPNGLRLFLKVEITKKHKNSIYGQFAKED